MSVLCGQMFWDRLQSFLLHVIWMNEWMKEWKNEWIKGVLGHICLNMGNTGPGEPPEDDEMNEMTLSIRHRILNSSAGGLRLSSLPLIPWGSSQNWIFTSEQRRNILECQSVVRICCMLWIAQVALMSEVRPHEQEEVDWQLLHSCSFCHQLQKHCRECKA